MAASATSTGIPNDTAKKRKGPPSATEIFTDPVPGAGDAAYNGDRVPVPTKKAYVPSSKQVFRFDELRLIACSILRSRN